MKIQLVKNPGLSTETVTELAGFDAIRLAKDDGTPVHTFDENAITTNRLRTGGLTFIPNANPSYPDEPTLYWKGDTLQLALMIGPAETTALQTVDTTTQ